jgi:hypothetical protein
MTELVTNLSIAPYYDDYDETKNFYRILFKPKVAVQARELTQIQTILQNQIQRFGTHIFKDGSVVDGVAISYIPRFHFVHTEDQFDDDELLVITQVLPTYLITNGLNSNTSVRAVPVITKNGFKNAYPNTNRVYVRYLSSGKTESNVDQETFLSGEKLYIWNSNQSKLGALNEDNLITTIDVLAQNGANSGVGVAYGASVSTGIVYQKGFFLKVPVQTITVKDFDTDVDQYMLGFETSEEIIRPVQDTSLNDASAGFSNANAPGADRLKLVPLLVSKLRSEVTAESGFFPIVQFDQEAPTQQDIDPVYNKLGEELARRGYEDSGDFYIKPFQVEAVESSNTSLFNYQVSPGIGYVQGYRVELIGSKNVSAPRATKTKVAQNQVVTANYGQYVVVNQFLGSFGLDTLSEVNIYDTAQTSISQYEGASGGAAGTLVGKANVKTVIFNSGIKGTPSATYLVYLFNIRMNSGRSFSTDAKSIVASSPYAVRADIVLQGGRAVLQDLSKTSLVFNTGYNAVRRLTDAEGVNDTSYVYRQTSTATLQANGFATFTLNTPAPGASESLNFSVGTLSDGLENDFNISLTANAFLSNSDGTVAVTSGNTTLVGTATVFQSQFVANDLIRVNVGGGNFHVRRVVSIANNTRMTLDTSIATTNAAANYQKYFVDGTVLNLAGANGTINVISNTQFQVSTSLTLDSGSQTTVAQYPVLRNLAVPAKKDARKNRLVKIDCSTNSAGVLGPWNLGFTDVLKIKNVWVGGTYANTNPDRLDWFVLDNGQKEDYYDHARLFIRPEHASKITSSSRIVVNLDFLEANTSSGVGFFSVDSYPVDDINLANTSAIQTSDIPAYAGSNGKRIELRNAIDFRPMKFNTAANVANTNPANTSITVNPVVSNTSFKTATGGQYLAEVDSNIRADVEYYLPRIDLITISKDGTLFVNQGQAEENPRTPFNENDTTVIASAFVPPYPSLTQRQAVSVGRRDLAIKINLRGNRNYTKKDIASLENRIKRLEYYTVLNALEQKARDLTIPDTNGLDRFKNGIFADPFNSHNIGKVSDFEYKIAIDADNGVARPAFKTHPVDFTYDPSISSGVQQYGSYVMRPFTSVTHITQTYASKFRNATEVEWNWSGNLNLYPQSDYFYDESRAPNINVSLDLAAPWEQFASSQFGTVFGDWRTIASTSSTTASTVSDFRMGGDITTTTTTNSTTQDRIVTDMNVNTVNNVYNLGSFVSDVSIQPFMRSRTVAFVATTLKPNTRVWPFFDSTNVAIHCAPGVRSGVENFQAGNEDMIVNRTGNWGDPLITDANGTIAGVFRIPAGQFRVGDRSFMLTNVDDLVVGADGMNTKAIGTYSASNVSVTKQASTLTTTEPRLVFNSTNDIRTLTNSTSSSTFVPWPQPEPVAGLGAGGPLDFGGDGGDADPFAQSFLVKAPSNVTGIFISQIGLFFRTKDPSLGVTVYVMEVRGGQPDISTVLGSAYLPSSAISAPGNNDQVETIFTFDHPIYLSKEKYYAFMIYPDATSPEYTFWMAETGGFDITTGQQIFQNPYIGTAFRSANQITWTALQEEDVKFNIYRAQFEIGSGYAGFINEDDEYLQVDGFIRANSAIGISVGDTVYTVNLGMSTNTSTFAPFGIVQTIDESNGFLQLDSSTGGFKAADTIRIYNTSNPNDRTLVTANNLVATATITEVKDLAYHAIVPRFATIQPSRTNITYNFKGTDSVDQKDGTFTSVQNNTETEFLDRERVAYSKSNETFKTSEFRIELDTPNEYISPAIDLTRKSSLFIENIINNDATNEHTRYGNAVTKYVSKNVVLADGQEAEDIKLFITAYRPVDTDVKVYIKFQNPEDAQPFDTKVWTELEYLNDGEFVYSNPANVNDYIEYEFGVPSVNAVATGAFANTSTGVVEYTNSDGARFVGFKTYSVKIVLLSSNKVRVPRLNDVRGLALQV